ncbi:unnamed protein product [Kuraishia capsulata CBS 1993]|uniref:Chromatin modification-related protein n=1 Tax=Kuraishia capsulata CBS 1993 TaxID=1382522 RepID=W6MKE7_9ASCO|nr:uncharacterized protein KUCA_T00002805001 [Kuraishia capsulata CBS 1993]CDK26831.1 unnamed protein product [Kuraishia capsulata CBS 1993]
MPCLVSNLPAELAHLLEELREKDLKYYDIRKRIQQRDSQLHKFIKQNGSLTPHPKEQQIYAKINEDFEKAEKLQEEKVVLANTSLFLITKHLTRLENDIERLEKDGLIAPAEVVEQEASLTAALSSLDSMASGGYNSSGYERGDSPSVGPRSSRKQAGISSRARSNTALVSSRGSTPGSTPSAYGIPGLRNKRMKAEDISDDDFGIESEPDIMATVRVSTNVLRRPDPTNFGPMGRTAHPPEGVNGNEEDELYCFCQQISYGNMVACDNPDCKYEWFHYGCVGLKEPPSGIWYCSDCKGRMDHAATKKKERKRR